MRRSHLLAPGLALTVLALPAPDKRLRRGACMGLAVYLGAVGLTSVRLSSGRAEDVLPLAAVFATMHLSWGFGFLAGCARFGLPLKAIGNALGSNALRKP